MILRGHNHSYARMNAVPGTDFVYVTVGNGGVNPHQDSGESGSPPKQYVRSNGALHWGVNNDRWAVRWYQMKNEQEGTNLQ